MDHPEDARRLAVTICLAVIRDIDRDAVAEHVADDPVMGRLDEDAFDEFVYGLRRLIADSELTIHWPGQTTDVHRLQRIGEEHAQHVTPSGMTSGHCAECDRAWPCPTHLCATRQRDPHADPWDPADDALMAAMEAEDEATT